MTDLAELVELMEGASGRFETVRIAVRSWIDREQFDRNLATFASNPRVAAWLRQSRRDEEPSGTESEIWRVWFRRPNLAREERYGGDPPSLVEASGRRGDEEWQYLPEEGRLIIRPASLSTVEFGTDDEGHPYSSYDVPPAFGAMFHPVVVELLDPAEVLRAGLSLEFLDRSRYLGREIIQARGWFHDWGDRRDPFFFENFPPSPQYALTVDAQVGIILRVACRQDDAEFITREVTEVSFDEPFAMDVFQPPAAGTNC